MRALEQRDQSLVLWRHSCEKHECNVPGFTMNVTGMFQNDAMLRQISESIQINKVQQDQLINTKSEWSHFRIPGAVVTQSWDEATNILSYDYCTVKLNSSVNIITVKDIPVRNMTVTSQASQWMTIIVLSILLLRHCCVTRYRIVPRAILYEVVWGLKFFKDTSNTADELYWRN